MTTTDAVLRLEIEPRSPRDQSKFAAGEKLQTTHEVSLKRLRAKQYEDHLSPAQAVSLKVRYLQRHTLPDQHRLAAQDLLTGVGEWVNVSAAREGETLTIYTPLGRSYHAESYSIGNLPSAEKLSLETIAAKDPKIITAVWGTLLEKLPMILQSDAYLILPTEYTHFATSDCDKDDEFGLGIVPAKLAASRGCKQGRMFVYPHKHDVQVPYAETPSIYTDLYMRQASHLLEYAKR